MSINLLKTKSVQLFDLPSGIRRRGNGVTARELAIVLQSGAVDDDLRSDSTFLDEIVETRIDDASAADKSSYMQILKTLEERHMSRRMGTVLCQRREGCLQFLVMMVMMKINNRK